MTIAGPRRSRARDDRGPRATIAGRAMIAGRATTAEDADLVTTAEDAVAATKRPAARGAPERQAICAERRARRAAPRRRARGDLRQRRPPRGTPRASDFQRLLTEGAGIDKAYVRRIRVRDRNAFVSVRREDLDKALAALTGVTIGGKVASAEPRAAQQGDADATDDKAPPPREASRPPRRRTRWNEPPARSLARSQAPIAAAAAAGRAGRGLLGRSLSDAEALMMVRLSR
ncbi:MAG: DbpA RNA binding domain-containing protein [Byssovorax sp.]